MDKRSIRAIIFHQISMIRFNLFGYPISISYYFTAMVAFLLLSDGSGAVFWGMLAAAFHEMGHVAMMKVLKCPKCRIRFTGCGIKIVQNNFGGYGYWRDFYVAVAGAAVNLFLFLLFIGAGYLLPWSGLNMAAMSQLAVASFNMMPVYPLDGGQAVYALLCRKFTLEIAELLSNVISFMFLLPLAFFAFYVLFRSRYNFSLLVMVIYLVVMLVLKEK